MSGLNDPLYQAWVHQLQGMRDQLEPKSRQGYLDWLDDQTDYIHSLSPSEQARVENVFLWINSERERIKSLLS